MQFIYPVFSESAIIAFASMGRCIHKTMQKIALKVPGTSSTSSEDYRSTKKPGSDMDEIQEKYAYLGTFKRSFGMLVFNAK